MAFDGFSGEKLFQTRHFNAPLKEIMCCREAQIRKVLNKFEMRA